LEILHKVFVECADDEKGKFAQYRFYAYISAASTPPTPTAIIPSPPALGV